MMNRKGLNYMEMKKMGKKSKRMKLNLMNFFSFLSYIKCSIMMIRKEEEKKMMREKGERERERETWLNRSEWMELERR